MFQQLKSQPWVDRIYCRWTRRRKSQLLIGPGNSVSWDHARIVHSKVEISGTGNRLILGAHSRFFDCYLSIQASNATIEIGEWGNFYGCHFVVEGKDTHLRIGKQNTGNQTMYAVGGSQGGITIGDDCMFAARTSVRNTDHHPLIDKETGERINPDRDVRIGDHVWLGSDVSVLKGCRIGSGATVGTMSLARGDLEGDCVYAGIPVRLIRRNVSWSR